jgi:hypothetical protein
MSHAAVPPPFVPLPAAERDALLRAARRFLGLDADSEAPADLLRSLDATHGYLRYHGSPSEEGRAIPSLAALLGLHLVRSGWQWARSPRGELAVIAPDGRCACVLAAVVMALLQRDDTGFGWLVRSLQQGERPALAGLELLAAPP